MSMPMTNECRFNDLSALRPPDDPTLFAMEQAARRLEESGAFRILRRLEPRPIRHLDQGKLPAGRRLAVVLDTETTGLDPEVDEILEIALVAVTYDETGIHDVIGRYNGLQEPVAPISPHIEALTGLTWDELRGHSIDANAVAAFVQRADFVIAHNAEFDRSFCQRRLPGLAETRWLCSCQDVDWQALWRRKPKAIDAPR